MMVAEINAMSVHIIHIVMSAHIIHIRANERTHNTHCYDMKVDKKNLPSPTPLPHSNFQHKSTLWKAHTAPASHSNFPQKHFWEDQHC